ncbi:MAG: sulfurtransferase TusA family protein [Candidatus Omnitrophica bacterium]|nr:sulfurtransferase TusA family protein [Candidatus Omnitrophota bacterium]
MADMILDVKRQKCPLPIVAIAAQLKRLAAKETLEIIADDPAFGEDVKAFCRVTNNSLESLTVSEGVFNAVIRKK